MLINYISYGLQKSGGSVYENILLEQLAAFQNGKEVKPQVEKCILKKPTSGIFNLRLILYGFNKATADINLCVVRTALGGLIRNLFSKRQVWVIVHNYDPSDGKKAKLKGYYILLFFLLRSIKTARIKVITVSPFFQSYFREILNRRIDFFPNLFDTQKYLAFQTNEKRKRIHLGQWSSKNDPSIFSVAKALNSMGYECFFTTLKNEDATVGSFFSINHYPEYEAYLQDVAHCEYTLALTRINEGWNRIAHESILLGTPVIGYANGGLGNLLVEANQIIVTNYTEVLRAISQNQKNDCPSAFIHKYDYSLAGTYLHAIFN